MENAEEDKKGNAIKLLKDKIRKIASDSLIDELRFIDAGSLDPTSTYKNRQPSDFMPGAKSIIVGSIYIGAFFLKGWEDGRHAMTSRLTLSGFYFNVVDPMVAIKEYLIAKGYRALIADGSNEETCIPLKPAAERAGLGWIGKNTLLLDEKYGSWQAIGAIITDADLAEIYPMAKNRCGNCRACMDLCPMNALERPSELIRERCLSHLLEEEEAPRSALEVSGAYLVECDLCQNVCPWNNSHLLSPLDTLKKKSFEDSQWLLDLLSFDSLMGMDEAAYKQTIVPNFSGISLSYKAFRRNLEAAYGRRKS